MQYFEVHKKILQSFGGIESKEAYLDVEEYDDRFMDTGESKPISLCDSLITYFLAKLAGYNAEFWQYVHPNVENFYLYE